MFKYYSEIFCVIILFRTTAYTAVLTPGDMLLVPPFWFHHVETLEESVSVNVWSDSPEYSIINEMYVFRHGLLLAHAVAFPFQIFQANSI